MTEEEYNLAWNDYPAAIIQLLKKLYFEDDYKDVTLMCEDGFRARAHKMILKMVSPVFDSVFSGVQINDGVTDSMMYLEGVQQQELEELLQFIYLGQVAVAQEKMTGFLETGRRLQVQGLSSLSPLIPIEDNTPPPPSFDTPPPAPLPITPKAATPFRPILPRPIQALRPIAPAPPAAPAPAKVAIPPTPSPSQPKNKKRKVIQSEDTSGHQEKLDHVVLKAEDIKEEVTEDIATTENGTDTFEDINEKVENIFNPVCVIPENVGCQEPLPCPQCGKVFRNKYVLVKHVSSVHSGSKFSCPHCDYQATRKDSLRVHIQSIHEGLKFPCKLCDYQGSQKSALNVHMNAVHNNKKIPCGQCDYKATFQKDLERHIQAKHDKIKSFVCDMCDYSALYQSALKRHKETKHTV